MAIVVAGKTYAAGSLGFILALLVLILCVVFWAIGKGSTIEMGMIAALALAYLIG